MDFDFLLLVGIGFFLVVIIRGIFFSKKAYQLRVKSILNLQQEIRSLVYERSAKFFIIEFDEYYIQYSKLPDTPDIYCEAVSNEYLSKDSELTKDQYEQIGKFQFILPGEKDDEGNTSNNFFKFYTKLEDENIELLLSELETLISDIYQYKEDIFTVKVNAK